MHIPSIEKTSSITIEKFETALKKALIPKSEYDVSRWLYVPDTYSEYRYILGTKGQKPLICIGINPSTAEPDNLDNTLKSVQRIALKNGFDSFIMFNIYAQRATNPDHMEPELNIQLHTENMKAFDYILGLYSDKHSPCIWAAWGTIIEKRPFLFHCLEDMINIGIKHNATWFTAGKRSKTGHPHHPLYLPKHSGLDIFNPVEYKNNFV